MKEPPIVAVYRDCTMLKDKHLCLDCKYNALGWDEYPCEPCTRGHCGFEPKEGWDK